VELDEPPEDDLPLEPLLLPDDDLPLELPIPPHDDDPPVFPFEPPHEPELLPFPVAPLIPPFPPPPLPANAREGAAAIEAAMSVQAANDTVLPNRDMRISCCKAAERSARRKPGGK
jgi:hypothetical protein